MMRSRVRCAPRARARARTRRLAPPGLKRGEGSVAGRGRVHGAEARQRLVLRSCVGAHVRRPAVRVRRPSILR